MRRQFANFLLWKHCSQMCVSCCSLAGGRYQRSKTAWRKLDSSPSTFGSGRCQTPSQVETPRNTMPTEMWNMKNRSVSIKEMLGTPTSLEWQTSSRLTLPSAPQIWWNLVALSFPWQLMMSERSRFYHDSCIAIVAEVCRMYYYPIESVLDLEHCLDYVLFLFNFRMNCYLLSGCHPFYPLSQTTMYVHLHVQSAGCFDKYFSWQLF